MNNTTRITTAGVVAVKDGAREASTAIMEEQKTNGLSRFCDAVGFPVRAASGDLYMPNTCVIIFDRDISELEKDMDNPAIAGWLYIEWVKDADFSNGKILMATGSLNQDSDVCILYAGLAETVSNKGIDFTKAAKLSGGISALKKDADLDESSFVSVISPFSRSLDRGNTIVSMDV